MPETALHEGLQRLVDEPAKAPPSYLGAKGANRATVRFVPER